MFADWNFADVFQNLAMLLRLKLLQHLPNPMVNPPQRLVETLEKLLVFLARIVASLELAVLSCQRQLALEFSRADTCPSPSPALIRAWRTCLAPPCLSFVSAYARISRHFLYTSTSILFKFLEEECSSSCKCTTPHNLGRVEPASGPRRCIQKRQSSFCAEKDKSKSC